jgi:hypothetical protein
VVWYRYVIPWRPCFSRLMSFNFDHLSRTHSDCHCCLCAMNPAS